MCVCHIVFLFCSDQCKYHSTNEMQKSDCRPIAFLERILALLTGTWVGFVQCLPYTYYKMDAVCDVAASCLRAAGVLFGWKGLREASPHCGITSTLRPLERWFTVVIYILRFSLLGVLQCCCAALWSLLSNLIHPFNSHRAASCSRPASARFVNGAIHFMSHMQCLSLCHCNNFVCRRPCLVASRFYPIHLVGCTCSQCLATWGQRNKLLGMGKLMWWKWWLFHTRIS